MSITQREIHDTFNALNKTAEYLESKWGDIETMLANKNRFIFVGCGSSYYTAKSIAAICAMRTGKATLALAAGDILLHAPRYKKAIAGATVVLISRSGHTSELIMALEALKTQDKTIATLALIAADDTPLGNKCDLALTTPWSFDESVCQTRCVTNFYFMGAYIFAKHTGDQATMDDLHHLLRTGAGYIDEAEKLAKEISELPWTHSVVLADAELEGLAEEGALVFKEICCIPSNYYHVLDVRHGPIVLIGEKTLVIAALGTESELEQNLLKDLAKKGAKVIAFSDKPQKIEGTTNTTLAHPLTQTAKGIPFILLCQLIGYEKSKKTGANPDTPKGLDPWIKI